MRLHLVTGAHCYWRLVLTTATHANRFICMDTNILIWSLTSDSLNIALQRLYFLKQTAVCAALFPWQYPWASITPPGWSRWISPLVFTSGFKVSSNNLLSVLLTWTVLNPSIKRSGHSRRAKKQCRHIYSLKYSCLRRIHYLERTCEWYRYGKRKSKLFEVEETYLCSELREYTVDMSWAGNSCHV